MKMGTAPASITVLVCMDVPDAMLVSAQAASNCRDDKLRTENLVGVLNQGPVRKMWLDS